MPRRRSGAFSAELKPEAELEGPAQMEKARDMAQVSVTIDGRKYRLACNEGEEARLESLAGLIDDKIGEMRAAFGEIGDQRLVIMAALTIADNLARGPRRSRGPAQALRRGRRARPSHSVEPRRARLEAGSARRAARGRRGGLIRPRPDEAESHDHRRLRWRLRGVTLRPRRARPLNSCAEV